MTDREGFLRMVRSALGIRARVPPPPDPATHLSLDADAVARDAAHARMDARAEAGRLLDEMSRSAAAIGWRVHRCASPEDAADTVLDICRGAGVRRALRSDQPVFDRVPVDRSLRDAGIELAVAAAASAGDDAEMSEATVRARLKAESFQADAGITGAEYAIAETGTVVLHSKAGASRLISAAPARHIAILEKGDVLPSLDELFLLERDSFTRGEHRGMINLISGPSRTGDIEAVLVDGVHGPVEVHLVLLG